VCVCVFLPVGCGIHHVMSKQKPCATAASFSHPQEMKDTAETGDAIIIPTIEEEEEEEGDKKVLDPGGRRLEESEYAVMKEIQEMMVEVRFGFGG
jgi:hypothetical protein